MANFLNKKKLSDFFYLLATITLPLGGVMFLLERLKGADNIPIFSLSALVGGLAFLIMHNIFEKQSKMIFINSLIFSCYFIGGFIL